MTWLFQHKVVNLDTTYAFDLDNSIVGCYSQSYKMFVASQHLLTRY